MDITGVSTTAVNVVTGKIDPDGVRPRIQRRDRRDGVTGGLEAADVGDSTVAAGGYADAELAARQSRRSPTYTRIPVRSPHGAPIGQGGANSALLEVEMEDEPGARSGRSGLQGAAVDVRWTGVRVVRAAEGKVSPARLNQAPVPLDGGAEDHIVRAIEDQGAMLTTALVPSIEPVVLPAPICNVPAVIVVTPV